MDLLKLVLLSVPLVGCVDLSTPDAVWQPLADRPSDLAPDVGSSPLREQAQPGPQLRVVTYNIENGGVDPSELAAAIQADSELARADVILVQEAEAFPTESGTRISRLATALGMDWIYAPARAENAGTLGNAILSRWPLDGAAVMDLPLATRKRQRIALAADVHVGSATVRIVTTQLDTTLNITDRVRQLHPIVMGLPDLALVGGDFNTNPYAWADGAVPLAGASAVVATDQAPMLDSYMSQQGFENFTAPLGTTEVKFGIASRLDAVYARGANVGDGNVDRTLSLSDHQPVWIDLTMPQ